jgi:hypothetical protein
MGTFTAVVIITFNAILIQSLLDKYPSEFIESRNRELSESCRCIWNIHLSKSIKYIMSYGHPDNTEQYCQLLRFCFDAPIALTHRPMLGFHRKVVHSKALDVTLNME